MQNTINKAALILLTLFLFLGTSLAQEENNSDKTKKKCTGECCIDSTESAKMDQDKMNHSNMMNMKSMDKNNDGQIYQCPMHADQISDEPGKCSECGMDLKKVSISDMENSMGNKDSMMEHNKMEDHQMSNAAMGETSTIDIESLDKNKDGKVFQCPMHADQISDEKGDCVKCGMHLKEVPTKDAQKMLKKYKHK